MRVRYFIIAVIVFYFFQSINAQSFGKLKQSGISAADDSIFHLLISDAKKKKYHSLPIGERIIAMGKLLLNTPYADKTLEIYSDESDVVCNFQGLDCVTFFENAWALAITIRKYYSPTIADYQTELANH